MLYFDAANTYYKSVTGAVEAGSFLRLSVILPRNAGVTACLTVIKTPGGSTEYINMDWDSTDGTSERWTKEISFDSTGIYFYFFAYRTAFGTGEIKRKGLSQKSAPDGTEPWQQTVYDPAFRTPEKVRDGIIYQIFPDRFYFSGKPKTGVPDDRILRSDTGNLPFFEPDSAGKILNNDYFCGDFRGIEEKLDYIASLGVSCIYLNPINEAHSNHRYDTADYMHPDPLLGTEEDFISLAKAIHERNMLLILDGVYSHTGADSVYFNRNGRYQTLGAYQSKNSPYRKWYTFDSSDVGYECWWGVAILPEVNENETSFRKFITGEGGVIRHWLELGADGFRFDVADELPDEFTVAASNAVKKGSPEHYMLGEVWEDATNKISYSKLRSYLLGGRYDGVMNYPFRNAVIDFLLSGNAESFMERVYSIVLNYPPEAMNCCMNFLSTHDTARILTVLSGIDIDGMTRKQQSEIVLSESQKETAEKRLSAALAMIFTLPGIPSVYYGDEAGMYGGKDPFNRCCYPWGGENKKILDMYRFFTGLRKSYPVLKDGGFYPLSAEMSCVAYLRYRKNTGRIALIANNNSHPITYNLNYDMRDMPCIYGGEKTDGAVYVPGNAAVILADEPMK